MKDKDNELSYLKNKLPEYKKNIEIGTALTMTGIVSDFGIANLHINDLSVVSLMATLVTVPGAIICINARDYKKTKNRINEIETKKVLKKELKAN